MKNEKATVTETFALFLIKNVLKIRKKKRQIINQLAHTAYVRILNRKTEEKKGQEIWDKKEIF